MTITKKEVDGLAVMLNKRVVLELTFIIMNKGKWAYALIKGLHAEHVGDDPGNTYNGTMMPDPKAVEKKLETKDAKSAKRGVKTISSCT